MSSPEPEPVLEALLRETDRVAEIQNTLRGGARVELRAIAFD